MRRGKYGRVSLRILVGKLEEKDNWEELGVDGE